MLGRSHSKKSSGKLESKIHRTQFDFEILLTDFSNPEGFLLLKYSYRFEIFRKELRGIRAIFIIRGVLSSFSIISRFAIFLTLITYICFGNIFTTRQVFVVTSCFNFLYDSMLYYWTVAGTSLAECYVSVTRIEEFLLQSEQKPQPKLHHYNYAFNSDVLGKKIILPHVATQPIVDFNENADVPSVKFDHVTAKWNNESQCGPKKMTFQIRGRQLVAIDGPLASGKSSILYVILRELEIDSGHLTVDGVVSYSSQEPWLFDATIRQNIVFTEKYDPERYCKVIEVCSLERDLKLLPAGDLTIVGESGACLSGGQKARINLARAIYRSADIYLLDDPLSAVDSAVGKRIFYNCIKEFLSDEICILVTNQKQFIKECDRLIYICDGKIQFDKVLSNNTSGKRENLKIEIEKNEIETSEKSQESCEKSEKNVKEVRI